MAGTTAREGHVVPYEQTREGHTRSRCVTSSEHRKLLLMMMMYLTLAVMVAEKRSVCLLCGHSLTRFSISAWKPRSSSWSTSSITFTPAVKPHTENNQWTEGEGLFLRTGRMLTQAELLI